MMFSFSNTQTILKTPQEIEIMRRAGAILREVRDRVGEKVRPGITTKELDQIAKQMLDARDAIPAFLGYHGFPSTLCTSVNEEIVHGIPSDRVLEEGDIVSIDIGLIKDGFFADSARTFAVGEIDEESARLLDITREALEIAKRYLEPGRRLFDLSAAVQQHVESGGFAVVREYSGHGIGKQLHEDPQIPNHGRAGRGPRWKEGMVVAVEPMVNVGTYKTRVLEDDWTVVTADGKRSAHFEDTIAITAEGPLVLT